MRLVRLVPLPLSLLLVCCIAAAHAEAPGGPRLAVLVYHPYSGAAPEVSSLALDGSPPFRIAGGAATKGPSPTGEVGPSWSADGSRVAFLGDRNGARAAVFTVAADGSDLEVVPLSRKLPVEGNFVLAPDGRSVAMMRIDVTAGQLERPLRRARPGDEQALKVRTAIWSLDVGDSGMRRLSAWSGRSFLVPSSFSADGSRLAATEWRRTTSRAISIDLSTRRRTVLADDAKEPVFGPDGQVATVRDHFGPKEGVEEERKRKSSTLLVLPAGGGRPRPLVRVRPGLSSPSWDPSGQRIAFTRLSGFPGRYSLFPRPNSIAEVNADGSCMTTVAKLTHGFFAGSAWQPGTGREAGRIDC